MKKFLIKHSIKNQTGSMLVVVLVASGLFLTILVGAISNSILQEKLNLMKVSSTQALHIAEAGVNYYRWVLYHHHEDYCNSETCKPGPDYGPYGPYAYKDSADGSITGYYELYITPPTANGSTIVNIKSIGWESSRPDIKRSIEVKCGISAWSSFSTLANATIRFGVGTEVWGPIHSNGGVRFDGITHNIITSREYRYDDPDHTDSVYEFGVHTHQHTGAAYDPNETCNEAAPPCNPTPQNYNDVFLAGRQSPSPLISFDLLDSYVTTTYAKATSSGIVFDGAVAGTADPASVAYFQGCATSGNFCDEGFHVTLKNNNTFDIRGVSSVVAACGNPSESIQSEEISAHNYPIPANGIVFVKGTTWVNGIVDGTSTKSRITILAFKAPFVTGTADININNDILYTNYDGSNSIGLIAQRDVNAGQNSEDDLRIDAALIAKTGRIGRNHYDTTCVNDSPTKITIFGSMATNQRYGFAWTDGTGYQIRNLVYDNNLTFAPPPHFPTTGEYTFISWKEN